MTLPPVRPSYLRITHPQTGRFVAEFDVARDLLLVVDHGHEGIIDLARIRAAAGIPSIPNGPESAIENIAT